MGRDSTCQLSLAGDMICMLRDGLLQRPEVEKKVGEVEQMFLDVSSSTEALNLANLPPGRDLDSFGEPLKFQGQTCLPVHRLSSKVRIITSTNQARSHRP